jgi:hypothetical protein
MILRRFVPLFIACLFTCFSSSAQENLSESNRISSSTVPKWDFSQTVVTIASLRPRVTVRGLPAVGIVTAAATGFCLDSICRFIATNYHVAIHTRPRKIRGQRVVQQYLATGPDDDGATVNDGPAVGPMKFALSRDLAIYELRYPIPQHQGVAFYLKDLQMGQEVDIYGFPKEGINRVRKLVQFHGTFKGETTAGLLSFDYSLNGDKALKPGVSGGIVVDSRSRQIVGVLSAIERHGEPIALAVSVQSLADFVCKVDPFLAQALFPVKIIPPISADLYPKVVAPHVNTLQQRPEEPAEVKTLRAKAQLLANGMGNFIALQTFAWGRGAERLPRMNPGATNQCTRKDRQLILEETLKLRF